MAEDSSSQLVVVGSSAGGIDALGVLVAGLPTPFPAPIVVAQHLDPRRVSHLDKILARGSTLPVEVISDQHALEPGRIYVIPSDRDVEFQDAHVRVLPPSDGGPVPSIDRLLRTAADAYGEQLVAVILSGAGSDGAAGARIVKAAGGTVVIQDPATAAHPSMPLSLAPTTVDIVARLEAIGPLLHELVTGAFRTLTPDDERNLDHFLAGIREQTGIDFSTYKRPTIRRRLDRRMAAVGADGLRGYMRYLDQHPDEYERLASSFLIKVTEFFRDPDLFEYLREHVVPEVIREADDHGREIRVWSAGTATGEEAYSLAMLFAEALGERLNLYNVRIFATDLDNEAINFARGGVYPRSAVQSVPEPLRERYFLRSGDDYEIRKQIRALTVFGQHDLGMRAPFPRIDVVVSRNVLIYFTLELQKRALQLFAFSLRAGGYLVLGKAESTSPFTDHFLLENPRLKVYRRQGERVLIPPSRVPAPARTRSAQAMSLAGPRRPDRVPAAIGADSRQTTTERAEGVLLRMPIGAVIVNGAYDIQFINNAARGFLGIHGVGVGQDLVHASKSLPSASLRSIIDGVFAGTSESFKVDVPREGPAGDGMTLVVSAHPYEADGKQPSLAVVVVEDQTDAERDRRSLEIEGVRLRDDGLRLRGQLESLTRTNDELLRANQELATANAELRSANEELLVGSEEVQAATEEVETLNEELQATNEELETLNEELQATVEELNTTNDDLEAGKLELEESAHSLEEQRRTSERERERLVVAIREIPLPVCLSEPGGTIRIANPAWDRELESLSDEGRAALHAELRRAATDGGRGSSEIRVADASRVLAVRPIGDESDDRQVLALLLPDDHRSHRP